MMTLRSVYPMGVRYMMSNKMKSLPMRVGQSVPSGYIRSNDYLNLDGVASYGQFEQDAVIPAGDDWEVGTDVLFNQLPTGNETVIALDVFFRVTFVAATSTLKVLVGDGGSVWRIDKTGTIELTDGTLHNITVRKIGNTYELVVDGVVDFSVASVFETQFKARFVGQRGNSSEYFSGIIANLYIKSLTTGQVLVDCPIDQKGSDTQPNRADATNNLQLFNVDPANDWVEGPL